MKKLFIILVGVVLAGCETNTPQTGAVNTAFVPIAKLLDQQIALLEQTNPSITKSIVANEKKESRVVQMQDWSKELEIFRALDISKPGLQGMFTIESPSPDVRMYTRKPGEKAVVEWLKVQLNENGQPIAFDGSIRQKNYLYQSEKHLRMQLKPNTEGKLQLATYQIDNQKKMLFSNPEHFTIEATVQ